MPKGGHVRLTGNECDEKDEIIAGKRYQVRYLGSSQIPNKDGKGCTSEAIREIYSRYSTKGLKSLTRRELFVSANCVSLYAMTEQAVIFRFKTVDITFCNTSEENRNAFAFVVKDTQSFHAHVVHCENPAQANDICVAMYHAFEVRCALHQAKRVDRAGWANGLLSSQTQHLEEREDEANENGGYDSTTQNGIDETDANNNFGEFACGVVLPCKGNICSESENNNNVNNARHSERFLIGDNGDKLYAQNGGSFSLAKMVLNKGMNRVRSQSLPHGSPSPWVQSNSEWGCYQSSELEDDDDFSLLARERSSSMKLLAAN